MPASEMIHVRSNGEILVDGEEVGIVFKLDVAGPGGTKWRAEVGDVRKPETYRVSYAKTRKAAVADVLEEESR